MTTIPEPYVLVTRADLRLAHLIHRNGATLLCTAAEAHDWAKVPVGIKTVCSRCLAALEDREYRSRDGGRSGMGRAG